VAALFELVPSVDYALGVDPSKTAYDRVQIVLSSVSPPLPRLRVGRPDSTTHSCACKCWPRWATKPRSCCASARSSPRTRCGRHRVLERANCAATHGVRTRALQEETQEPGGMADSTTYRWAERVIITPFLPNLDYLRCDHCTMARRTVGPPSSPLAEPACARSDGIGDLWRRRRRRARCQHLRCVLAAAVSAPREAGRFARAGSGVIPLTEIMSELPRHFAIPLQKDGVRVGELSGELRNRRLDL
jgi:hypothetical protein